MEKESRRGQLEIFEAILKTAKRGAKKTRIVYHCNLNFTILKGHLEALKESHLISEEDGSLKTTPKGNLYLERFNGLVGLVKA